MASTDFGDQLRGDEIEVYRQHVDNWIQNDLSNAAPAGQEKEFPKDWNMMDCELPVEDPEAGMENPLSAFGLSSLSSLPAEGHSDFMHPGFASNINPAVASGITHAVPEFSVPPREEQGRRTGSQPRYTAAEWEAKRTLIASLWIDQNKSLEETQHIMAEQHGFDAHESAYKYKLKTWRMYKNIKARHKKLIQQIKQRRKDEHGKDTMFFLHGRRVDNSKIPARKPVSGTSTIGSIPSCLSWTTPRSSQISNGENQFPPTTPSSRPQEQAWAESFVPTQTSLTLQSQAVPEVIISNTEHFSSLKAKLVEILSDKHNVSVDPDVSSTDAFGDVLLQPLGDFAIGLGETGTSPASIANFALSATFLEELGSIQRAIEHVPQKDFEAQGLRWFFLPIFTWQAQCLLAAHRFPEGEALLGKVLSEYAQFSSVRKARDLKKTHPVIMLIGKAYLAQEKFHTLEKVIQSELQALLVLGDLHVEDLFEESLSFKKLLFIGRTYQLGAVTGTTQFYNLHYSTCQKTYAREHAVLADELARSVDTLQSELWIIGILDILRFRYEREMNHERLEVTLQNMEQIYEWRLAHTPLAVDINTAWTAEDRHMVHAVFQRMVHSYRTLGRHREPTKWDRFRDVFLPPDQAPTDPPQESASDFEYAMAAMGHLFRRFLGEWPAVELPLLTPAVEPVTYF